MTKDRIKEKLEQVVSKEPSQWNEDAKFRFENKKWLKRSQAIALKVLLTLRARNLSQKDLAEKMGVSAQLVSKWIKGNENFTLDTITKLEETLQIQLITVSGIENRKIIANQPIVMQVKKSDNIDSPMIKQSDTENLIMPLTPGFIFWNNPVTCYQS